MTERERIFRDLVDRQRDLIWHVCSDYSLSAAWEVQDAFQEVLCILWRDLDTFRGNSSERTWVYRVATTTMLMLKRKQGNRPQPAAERIRDEAVPDDEGYQHLMQLIDHLDRKDAQIVHAHLHGFNQEEIAHICRCSVPTVARRMAKAREWLRKHYYN